MSKKRILCFGDSNTYGFIPENGLRYDENTRWTGILKKISGDEFQIIEAGGNNRTGFTDSVDGENFTGYKLLTALLENDLYAVILAVGTNDLQKFYYNDENDIKNGLENLIKIINSKNPDIKIILLSPTNITRNILKSYFALMFDEISIKKSLKMSEIYKRVAQKHNCIFIDLNDVAKVSDTDGLHFAPESHRAIADKVYEVLTDLTKQA